MVKRLLGVYAVAALVLAGCGSAPPASLGTRIVGNNAAGYHAESRKKAVLFYGELDVEMLMRIKPSTRTPDRPTAPQPIRPKPQAGDALDVVGTANVDPEALLDRSEIDFDTGHSAAWLAHLDAVASERSDLAEQRAFLRQTPAFQIDEIHRLFDEEIDSLPPAAAKEREAGWRSLTPTARLAAFKARQRELADRWKEPVVDAE